MLLPAPFPFPNECLVTCRWGHPTTGSPHWRIRLPDAGDLGCRLSAERETVTAGGIRFRPIWPVLDNRLAARPRPREHHLMGTASSDAVKAGFLIRKPRAGEERELGPDRR